MPSSFRPEPSNGEGYAHRVTTSMQTTEPEYQVALSFAGEQRTYVREVASELAKHGVKTFFDQENEIRLWGKNLVEEFQRIFMTDSNVVVMFISKEYAEKEWPRHERRSALTRALHERREYVLPVRFDDTVLPGLDPDALYLPLNVRSPAQLAKEILEKLVELGCQIEPALTVAFDPSDPACVQDRRGHPTQPDFQLRLRATNTWKVALTEVRCRLRAEYDTYGRIRHDDTQPYDRSHNGITLLPGASDYFDIAFCHFRRPQMVIQYANPYLLQEQAINQTHLKTAKTPLEVTFEARREDTNEWLPTVTKRYVVAPDGDAITLTEADADG